MADRASTSVDRHLPADVRAILEERFWRPVEDAARLEALEGDRPIASASGVHPTLFADHGVVHVRDVAAGVVDLAETAEGVLFPARDDDRRSFVVDLAVLLAYLHDVGMHDSSPEGRRIHALVAAHLPFSGALDDVLDRIASGEGAVVRRIADVHAAAPFRVEPRIVLRELASLAVAHSKSTIPAGLLADVSGLRRALQHVLLADLEWHRATEESEAGNGSRPAAAASANVHWYADPERDAYAWLDSTEPPHRALADDAIDAVRLVRAADALRQRGTKLRTAAGYEIFVDAETGRAVFALRTARNDRLLLLRTDSPLSAGEANLRGAFVTPYGDLRVSFHRGRFSSPEAAAAARIATARVVADIGADLLGAFGARRPSPDLPELPRDPSDMRVEIERPHDDPSFADAVAAAIARHDVALAGRVAVVADLEGAAAVERARYFRATVVRGEDEEAERILGALGAHGMKVAAVDRLAAFEDVRHAHVDAGEVVLEAGSWPSFVYVATGPGLRVQPLGGYEEEDVPAWVPVGITGVVRQAERNSTIVAEVAVDVLVIPGELFAREWFRPYEPHEIDELLAGTAAG
jgi:hypothetical protein